MTNLINPLIVDDSEALESAVIRADNVSGAVQGEWTYAAYAAIPADGKRYEIIDGVLYQMPSPAEAHQFTITWLVYYLTLYVQIARLGTVYTAPFDVKLFKNTTVQPDVLVVLKANKKVITKKNISGAPDLVVEVSSPGTSSYDRTKKRRAYAAAGVRELWIVRPDKQTVEVFALEASDLVSKGTFKQAEPVVSTVIADFPVTASQFFSGIGDEEAAEEGE